MAGTQAFERGSLTEADLVAPDLSVVVTVYNEAGSLEELYRRTLAVLDPGPWTFELIFVDDGSTDGTFAASAKRPSACGGISCRLARGTGGLEDRRIATPYRPG